MTETDTSLVSRGEQKALTNLLDTFIKAETNLERLPFFAPWTKSRNSKLRHSLHRKTSRNGVDIEISWTVSANPEYGYPNAFDLDVYRALQQIIRDFYNNQIPEDGIISFSFRQLEQRMQQESSGRLKKDIRASLERLVATTIKSKGMFYYKETQQYIDDTFHIFDRVTFIGQTMPGGKTADTNYLELSRWYCDSLRAWYVMPLDNQLHFSLRSSSAKALYGLLSFYFFCRSEGQEWIRRKYSDLCQETIISRAKYFSAGVQNLQNAFKELQEKAFLSRVNVKPLDKHDGWIYFWPGDRLLHPERFITPDSLETQPMLWNEKKEEVVSLPQPPVDECSVNDVVSLITKFYAALNNRDTTNRVISKSERDLVTNWIQKHGSKNFEDFIGYAIEQKNKRWPEMAALTGAINAYGDEFIQQQETARRYREQEILLKQKAERNAQLAARYQTYLKERLQEIERLFPDLYAQYQKKLHNNITYQQILKSIQDGHDHWVSSKDTIEANIATQHFSPEVVSSPQAHILDFVDWSEQNAS